MKTKSLLRIINFSLLGVILALVVVLSGSGTAHAAGSFRVLSTVCLDDQTTVDVDPLRPGHAGECDGSNAPGANVALTGTFGVGLGPDGVARNADDEPDYNFGLSVSFIPPEWGVAKGTDVPIGAIVGGLKSDATLGLLGNACRSPVKVDFTFVNASTNPADVIFPEAPGEDDRLEPLALDSNGNGIADGAEKWPAYLNDIDAFARITASDIRARMFGFNNTSIADLTVVLMMIIFEPGADLLDDEDEVIDIDPRLGPISVTVLQDPTAPASAGDAVSDFCSPLLSSSINYGLTEDNPNTAANEAGKPWRTNPPDGAYSSIAAAVPQRDADGDGIENGLDPCPFDNDSGWDPRGDEYQPGADDDEDGLPNSCDPKPFVQSRLIGAIFDEDEDFWGNRMDNCPLVPNEDNNDEDGDGIGDACDPHPNDADAEGDPEPLSTCVVTVLEIGAGGTPPIAAGTYQPCTLETLSDLLPPADGGAGDGTTVTPKKVEKEVKAGETVSSSELGYATPDDPVVVDVTSPIGDTISIEITDSTVTPPQGFSFLSWQVEISGPDASPDDPLVIVFQLDASILNGENENTIQIFKDGVQVSACSGASGTASPDPCVSNRQLLGEGESAGDVEITVLTSTASSWNFGVAGTVAGETAGPGGGAATGVGSLAPVASSIPAWAAIASALGGAGLLGSLGAFLARFVRRRRY